MKIVQLTTDNREPFKDYGNPMPHFGTAPEALLQGFAHLPEAEVHVVSCVRQPMMSPTKLAENIWYHSLVVPKFGWMTSSYQGCIRAVRKKLREIQPDIVHGQGTERDCAVSAVFSGFKNVLTIHGNMRLISQINRERPFSFNWLAARLEGFTLPKSSGVVCITRYTEAAVAPLARRTWVVPNAVDAAFFSVRPAPETVPLILCVGLICERKNQNAFIRALDPLTNKLPFQLVFLGHVPETAYGREFRELVHGRKWCRYEGFASREKLREYLARATTVALPSIEDNCPMVVLESMAAGVPVLAARVGGVPDLIEEGRAGSLFDPLDEVSLRSGTEQVLRHLSEVRNMAAVARQEAEQRFHPWVIARRHLEIYREVLSVRS